MAAEASLGFGEVIGVDYGGRRWVVWRTESGDVAAASSRCPHQWADLADGFVDGEELVCAEHHWRFDTEGSAWKVNVRGRRDRKGRLEVLPVRRRDGYLEVGIRCDVGDPPEPGGSVAAFGG